MPSKFSWSLNKNKGHSPDQWLDYTNSNLVSTDEQIQRGSDYVEPFRPNMLREQSYRRCSEPVSSKPLIKRKGFFSSMDLPSLARKSPSSDLPMVLYNPSEHKAVKKPPFSCFKRPALKKRQPSSQPMRLWQYPVRQSDICRSLTNYAQYAMALLRTLPEWASFAAVMSAICLTAWVLYEVHRIIGILERAMLNGFLLPLYFLTGGLFAPAQSSYYGSDNLSGLGWSLWTFSKILYNVLF